eukprot:3492631-Rhodomonas_salina.3
MHPRQAVQGTTAWSALEPESAPEEVIVPVHPCTEPPAVTSAVNPSGSVETQLGGALPSTSLSILSAFITHHTASHSTPTIYAPTLADMHTLASDGTLALGLCSALPPSPAPVPAPLLSSHVTLNPPCPGLLDSRQPHVLQQHGRKGSPEPSADHPKRVCVRRG